MPDQSLTPYLSLAAEIVAAFVCNNSVPASELPAIINAVHSSLAKANAAPAVEVQEALKEPAVPIKKSVEPDFIICLEDGKKFKTLRRHLASSYSLSPEQYRAKWRLPDDYPMVAPSYAAKRSELAKEIGLGTRRPASSTKKALNTTRAHARRAA